MKRANRTILPLDRNVPEQFDLWPSCSRLVIHADDFEAPRAGRRQVTEVLASHSKEFAALRGEAKERGN